MHLSKSPESSKILAYFLLANGITDQSKQKAMLLAMIVPSAYKLLRSLVALTKPDKKSYDELLAPQPRSFGNSTKIQI